MNHPGYHWEAGEPSRREVRVALGHFGPKLEEVRHRDWCVPCWYVRKHGDAPLWLAAIEAATGKVATGLDLVG